PGLANFFAHAPLLRTVAKSVLGIHGARELPRFAHQDFRAWFTGRRRIRGSADRQVLLFADTFNRFFEPAVAAAAVEVLERAGCEVSIPGRDLCCGRPLYDQGMLDRAKRVLSSALELLAPPAQRGVAIVGLEPSCILTFRDELP